MARSIFLYELDITTSMIIGAAAALAAKKLWDVNKQKRIKSKYGLDTKESNIPDDIKYYNIHDVPEIVSRATEVKK